MIRPSTRPAVSALAHLRGEHRDALGLLLDLLVARRDRDSQRLDWAVRGLRRHGLDVQLMQPDPAPSATNRQEVAR